MTLRSENQRRPLRPDQHRCRRCAAPILISTARRHRGKCAPCTQVPRWVNKLGIYRRTALLAAGMVVAMGATFHAWTLYDWAIRWRETFMEHPFLYCLGAALVLASVALLGLVIRSARASRKAGGAVDSEEYSQPD